MEFSILFPGQGSQFVGMGAELFDARPDLLGSMANEILGFDLRGICLNGPEDLLTRTEHAQPALFALSFALWDQLYKALPGHPSSTAGHSLGEYTALVSAGALDYPTALRVVGERGRAMGEASDLEGSGMAALVGADPDSASQVCDANRAAGGRLTVANDNAPGQVVVAGALSDIEWLESNAREHGVRRAIPLKVAGAFHSQFMEPAAERVADALQGVVAVEPRWPVYSNVTAEPVKGYEIPHLLSQQVTSRVRFRETLINMSSAGTRAFVHCGPGDVTAGMAKRTVQTADVIILNDLSGIPDAVERLSMIPGSEGGLA